MPKSNPKSDKYANKSPQLRDAGFLVTLGSADEIAHHYRRYFHQFLEYLSTDPSASNPLDQVGGGKPALRDAMCRAGIAGLTRDELFNKRKVLDPVSLAKQIKANIGWFGPERQ